MNNPNLISTVQTITQKLGAVEIAAPILTCYLDAVTIYRGNGWDLSSASQQAVQDVSQVLNQFQSLVFQGQGGQFYEAGHMRRTA